MTAVVRRIAAQAGPPEVLVNTIGTLIRILDLELRPLGIRVNAVAPQLIDTAADRATFSAELLTHAVRPEAIANVIAFLAGDLAAPVSDAIVPAYVA